MCEWAVEHGLLRRQRDESTGEWFPTAVPLSLYPATFPEGLYYHAQHIQPLFNVLVHRMVVQRHWLEGLCERLAQHDDFVAQLLNIWKQSKEPRLRLGVFRSDYFARVSENGTLELKQVELNTIAASFPYLAELLTNCHQQRGENSHLNPDANSTQNQEPTLPGGLPIPDNRAAHEIAACMSTACLLFAKKHEIAAKDLCCVMIVDAEEGNIYDQNGLAELVESPVFRLSLAEAFGTLCLSTTGHLQLEHKTVALVYFRSGYAPADYVSADCWAARLRIEQSTSVRVPDIGCHLAGLKKVQQELSDPQALALFIPEEDEARNLQDTFVELLPLDADDHGDENAQRALTNPSKWVIKPQREGGGHNIYDTDIPDFLSSISRTERAAHILMERILPRTEPLMLLRNGRLWVGEAVSELGIYGSILVNDGVVVENKAAGYLVRSKPSNVHEGGVAAGFAYLNSIQLLVD